MTKKNLIALADAIKSARKSNPLAFCNGEVRKLANFCASQNPAFKADRWFDYIDGKCGKNGGAIK